MRKMIFFLLLTFVVVGCGQNGPAVPDVTAPTDVAEAAAPAALVAEAQAQLAAHLGVEASALTAQQAEAKEWPDAAIGCAQKDMMYPQVITPGYLMVFSDDDTTYEVHTGDRKGAMILCQNEQPVRLTNDSAAQPEPATNAAPTRLPVAPAPTAQAAESGAPAAGTAARTMSDLAREKLATDLGMAADAVNVVDVQAVEWRDGSLGCPKPGMMYPQVITPGYQVTLEANGTRYTYHTNTRQQVVRCDAPSGKGGAVTQ